MQQTLFSNVYLGKRSRYADAAEIKAFVDGMLYTVNTFYRLACYTTVIRDEDINFPQTTDAFSPSAHPVLKDLTLEGILAALKS